MENSNYIEDFNSKDTSSNQRKKSIFSREGNSVTEMHKLLSMKGLAKGAGIPEEIINIEKQRKVLRHIIDTRPQNRIIIEKQKSYDQGNTRNLQETTTKDNKLSQKQQLPEVLSTEQIKSRIEDVSYSNQENKKIIRNEDFPRFEKAIFQLLYNKTFVDLNFNVSTKATIKQLQKNIKINLEENERLDNLLLKFRPPNYNNIPQRKLTEFKYLNGDNLFNFLENLYFCEMLVQFFGNGEKNSNVININGREYKIYYATILEDKIGVDIILYDEEHIFGMDITTENKKIDSHQIDKQNNSLKMKKIDHYDKVVVVNYIFHKTQFLRFVARYNSYIVNQNINKIPQIINFITETTEEFKKQFIKIIAKLQKNNSSDGDQNTDSNVETDESNSHRMTSQ